MLKEKIKVTHIIRSFIMRERNKATKSGIELSKALGKSDAWISSLENGRIKSITSIDLINIIKILLNCSKEYAEKYIETELEKIQEEIQQSDTDIIYYDFSYNYNNYDIDNTIKEINSIFYEFYDKDNQYVYESLKMLLNNCKSDIGFIMGLLKIDFTQLNYDDKKYIFDNFIESVNKIKSK